MLLLGEQRKEPLRNTTNCTRHPRRQRWRGKKSASRKCLVCLENIIAAAQNGSTAARTILAYGKLRPRAYYTLTLSTHVSARICADDKRVVCMQWERTARTPSTMKNGARIMHSLRRALTFCLFLWRASSKCFRHLHLPPCKYLPLAEYSLRRRIVDNSWNVIADTKMDTCMLRFLKMCPVRILDL